MIPVLTTTAALEKCPDKEGIKTGCRVNVLIHSQLEKCPDKEGIKTHIAGKAVASIALEKCPV